MYTLPPVLKKEIEDYSFQVKEYRSGNIEPVEFRASRVPMGIYEQRVDDTFMVRVRCTGGYITPGQLAGVARIATKYHSPVVHVTTRQEIQIQNVELEDTVSILNDLHEIGLSSRGGGGNTIRNIMASVDSGISPDDVFDVLPYAVALTNKMVAEPDSWNLPRKFKISFSSSESDNAYAAFNDLGFIATTDKGKPGFKVYIGGSLGIKPMIGHVLFEFLNAPDMLYVAEAIKNLFSRYGNRRNKHKARLRHVFYKMGKEKVFEWFHQIYNEIRAGKNLKLDMPHLHYENQHLIDMPVEEPVTSGFESWEKRYVQLQKQNGLFSIIIPIDKGNITPDKLEELGIFLKNFGEDVIRFSMRQNIHLRNIPRKYLGNIYNFLKKSGYGIHKPFIFNSLVTCTGADTCRLGICYSKGAYDAILKELGKSNLDLDQLGTLNINISGCPNSCGQHIASDLGFQGKAGRTDRIYPAYNIVAGGRAGIKNSRLAEFVDEINAYDLPRFVAKLLGLYLEKKQSYKSFSDYIDEDGKNDIIRICNEFRKVPDFYDDKNYYFDWGAENLFTIAGRGTGECSAGLFDMIDFDMNNIRQYTEDLKKQETTEEINELLYRIIFSSSRMLLITRGIEPKNNYEVFNGFINRFIEDKLVDYKYLNIIELARDKPEADFSSYEKDIIDLSRSVINLYENMDDSLQFFPEQADDVKAKYIQKASIPLLKKDYRGIACPMNFVKTKIELSKLSSGDLLEVLLDDGEPIENVPGSVKNEGHKIIKQTSIDDHWSVIIEKK